MKTSKNNLRLHRKKRISAKIKGTAERPRLSVFRSLKGVYVQIINDEKKVTIGEINSKNLKSKNNIEGARKVGEKVAELCRTKKIAEVVFDRGGYKYHGKVKALAEGAREGGLKF